MKEVIALDDSELLELEMILVDEDGAEALRFLKKLVYAKIKHTRRNRLKSHLDGGGDPVTAFQGDTGRSG
jgi:hypothetical protein